MLYYYKDLISSLIVFCAVVIFSPSAAGQTLELQTTQDIVLMGIGGWASCSSGRTPETQYIGPQIKNLKRKLDRQLRSQYNVQIVYVCSPYKIKSSNGNQMMSYRIVGSTQKFVNGPRTNQSQSGRVAVSNVASLLRIIQKKFNNPLVYVIGHSHGGYTAMKAVADSPYQVKGLYTLEPIDPNQCNTRKFLRNQTRMISIAGCRQSPRMNANTYARIARNADHNWHNVTFLHRRGQDNGQLYSSIIPGSFTSEHILHIHYKSDTHHNLGFDSTTWAIISDDVSRNIESN